jgi:nicotinamide riboside kinase
MRVYFSGGMSLGKSTVARHIAKHYKMNFISETARMILSEQELQIDSLRCNLDVADKFQEDVFHRQLEEEKKYKEFVSDRSVLDILAYSAQYSRILPKLLKHQDLTEYLDMLKARNSFVFFVRPTKATLKADGVREILNWDAIVSIDGMIKLLLEQHEIKYFTINTENMQERIREVTSVLDLHMG